MSTDQPSLPDDPTLLQHLLRETQAEITRLHMLIAALLRNRFGRRSERLGEAAPQRGVEDAEQSLGEQEAKLEAAQPAAERTTKPPKRNRGSLPEHLPRVEAVVDTATRPAPVVARACIRSAKTAPRGWITSRRSHAFS